MRDLCFAHTHSHLNYSWPRSQSLCEISSFCPATTLSGNLPRKIRWSVHSALGRDLSLKLTITTNFSEHPLTFKYTP